MSVYHFEVAERIVRTAAVEASNATQAGKLLRRWAAGEGHLADDDAGDASPITLSDYESAGFTFRSIKGPGTHNREKPA